MSAHALELLVSKVEVKEVREKSRGSLDVALPSRVVKVKETFFSSVPVSRMAHTEILPAPSLTV